MDNIDDMLAAITRGRPNTLTLTFNEFWLHGDEAFDEDAHAFINQRERRAAARHNRVWTAYYFPGDEPDPDTVLEFAAATPGAALGAVVRSLDPRGGVARTAPTAPADGAANNIIPFTRPSI